MWDDFTQEETREKALHGKQVKGERDENIAFSGHVRKGKEAAKLNKGERGSSQDGKKDMSKVKCFACYKPEHYASQCPERKR